MCLSTTNPNCRGVLTGTSAAGTLLLPRLLATATDFALGLSLSSTMTVVVQDSLEVELHADLVDFMVEESRELDIILKIASSGEKLCTSH